MPFKGARVRSFALPIKDLKGRRGVISDYGEPEQSHHVIPRKSRSPCGAFDLIKKRIKAGCGGTHL